MAKATVTIIRQAKTDKALAAALGGATITEAMLHFNKDGMTVHARDVRLRRLTQLYLFPVNSLNAAHGSVQIDEKMNNFASISIFHIGTQAGKTGSAAIRAGTKQDFYGIFIGD